MSENKYKIGDVVVLKSGGPRMAVTAVGKEKCALAWFGDNELHKGDVAHECLTPAFVPECSSVDLRTKPCPDCGSPERSDSPKEWPKRVARKIVCAEAPRFYQEMFKECQTNPQLKDQTGR